MYGKVYKKNGSCSHLSVCYGTENVPDRSSGDLACDSYHLYKVRGYLCIHVQDRCSNLEILFNSGTIHFEQEDVKLLKKLKVQAYRLSIAWSRVLPSKYRDKNILSLFLHDFINLAKLRILHYINIYICLMKFVIINLRGKTDWRSGRERDNVLQQSH